MDCRARLRPRRVALHLRQRCPCPRRAECPNLREVSSCRTHYELENSADSIRTPDFRILLRGPGEFHFGISADSRGNMCVRTLPGDTGSAIISELIGDGTYKVEPGELLVLGRLSGADPTVPGGCGCRAPTVPVMRASLPVMPVIPESSLQESVRLAQPW